LTQNNLHPEGSRSWIVTTALAQSFAEG